MKISLKISDLLIFGYFIGFWLRYFTNLNVLYSLIIFLFSASCTFIFCIYKSQSYQLKKLLILICIIDIIAAIAVVINKNHTLADVLLLFTWQNMGILYYKKREDLSFIHILSMISSIYIIGSVFLGYLLNNRESGNIFVADRTGSNTISILLIQFLIIDVIWREKNRKQKQYIYYIIVCSACVIAGGVAGIISTFVLIIGIYLTEENKKVKRIIRWTCVVFCLTIIMLISSRNVLIIYNFIQSGDLGSRQLMWNNYKDLVSQSLGNFLFGANISGDYLLEYYKNLHSTFFNWHYFYGLIPTIFFVGIVFLDCTYFLRSKKKMYLILVLVTIMRAATDETTYAFMLLWIFFFCMRIDNGSSKYKKSL